MATPYQPPQATSALGVTDEQVSQRRKFWLRAIWISIAGVLIPLIFGLIGTVVGMMGAFDELSKSSEADPEALAGNISIALLTTASALAASVISFLVLIGVLIRFFTLPKAAGTSPPNLQVESEPCD